MFRKFITALCFTLFASVSMAGTVIDTDGLSEAQIAELKAIAAKKVAETANNAGISESPGALVTLAATWGPQMAAAAEGFAKALGIAARELNITVNEFLQTDAGKITAVLIIWKVAGASILSILYSMVILIVGMTFVRVIYLKLFTDRFEKVEYSYLGGFIKGSKMVRVPKTFGNLRNDGEWLMVWVMIGICAITLLVAGTIIL